MGGLLAGVVLLGGELELGNVRRCGVESEAARAAGYDCNFALE